LNGWLVTVRQAVDPWRGAFTLLSFFRDNLFPEDL
jgi:hypothetical protein